MTRHCEKDAFDVCILGLGYIGLPTASLLANKGFRVLGVDVNEGLVCTLRQGKCFSHEPELDTLAQSVLRSHKLTVDTKPDTAGVFIICVPTPFTTCYKPDLSYVDAATNTIAPFLAEGNLVILESTVPVGTTEKMAESLARMRPDLRFGQDCPGSSNPVAVAHCPERVLPGHILRELVENDRIVGGIDRHSSRKGSAFYQTFVNGEVQSTDSRTAEMIKLTENSFRDVNVAFANELSLVCEELGIDVWEVIALANRHPRVNILRPGAGVGGHCIAVDPWFLVDSAPELTRLIRTARTVNDAKPEHIIARTRKLVRERAYPTIACLGLAFKPNVEDLRGSPALHIAETLAGDNINLLICEPHLNSLPQSLQGRDNVRMLDMSACLQQGEIILILVGHAAFADIDANTLEGKTVIDACGLLREGYAVPHKPEVKGS